MKVGIFVIVTSHFVILGERGTAQTEPATLIRLTAVRDAYPFWSPDGKQIVFQSDRHDTKMGDRDI